MKKTFSPDNLPPYETWWEIRSYVPEPIPLKVVRSSDASIWYLQSHGYRKEYTEDLRRRDGNVFPSWEEARAAKIANLRDEEDALRYRLKAVEERLVYVESLVNPMP